MTDASKTTATWCPSDKPNPIQQAIDGAIAKERERCAFKARHPKWRGSVSEVDAAQIGEAIAQDIERG